MTGPPSAADLVMFGPEASAMLGGEETGRFATRGRQIPPPVVLRGDKHEAKSLS
jgi:hypothetical protein